MEIKTNDYSYQEYIELYNKSRRENFKIMIRGVCEECSKEFTKKTAFREDSYYLCSACLAKKTIIKKYGSIENMKKQTMEKIRATNLKKYGCECSFQSEKVKDKIKETLTDRYGNGTLIENPSQIKEIKKKIKKTNLERYGTEYYLGSKDCKEKTKNTSIKNME